MVVDSKKSGVYFDIEDNSKFLPSNSSNGFKGSFWFGGSSSAQDSLSFRVRIDVQGVGLLIGDLLPNFILDEGDGRLSYLDDLDGSPSEDKVSLNELNGWLLLDEED